MQTLPEDSTERKDVPLARGLLDYFPAALAEVARLSKVGNEKHNPGEELHHARGKSTDHADCILRHLIDRGIEDDDGFLHEVKVAWRALALLQEALEAQGAPLARGARVEADGWEEFPTDPYGRPLRCSEPIYLDLPASGRIAGDTDLGLSIKADYYDEDGFEIVGYCAHCDRELTKGDIIHRDPNFFDFENVIFCSRSCIEKLLDWQGRTR